MIRRELRRIYYYELVNRIIEVSAFEDRDSVFAEMESLIVLAAIPILQARMWEMEVIFVTKVVSRRRI